MICNIWDILIRIIIHCLSEIRITLNSLLLFTKSGNAKHRRKMIMLKHYIPQRFRAWPLRSHPEWRKCVFEPMFPTSNFPLLTITQIVIHLFCFSFFLQRQALFAACCFLTIMISPFTFKSVSDVFHNLYSYLFTSLLLLNNHSLYMNQIDVIDNTFQCHWHWKSLTITSNCDV